MKSIKKLTGENVSRPQTRKVQILKVLKANNTDQTNAIFKSFHLKGHIWGFHTQTQ